MRKYEYFYDSDKVLTHIDDAFKPNIYTSIEGIEFIVRDGDVNIKHYAVKDTLKSLGFGFTGGGESPEHYNAKMKIVKELKYYDDVFNQEIHFAKVVPEKGINDKIPDLSCYDKEDNLVMLIEIKYTNEKSEEDIKKLAINKIPLIEIDIKNDNKCKHLILPEALEVNKPRLKEVQRLFKESSKGFKEKIEQAEREYENYAEKYSPDINSFREGIRELEDGMQSKGTGRNREMESSKESIRDGIRERKQRGSEIRNDIKSFKRRISNNNEATFKNEYRLGKIRSEIDGVELGIKERRKNTEQIAGSCKIEWFRSDWMQDPVKNKLEEIRYWCS
mgnify:FL=1